MNNDHEDQIKKYGVTATTVQWLYDKPYQTCTDMPIRVVVDYKHDWWITFLFGFLSGVAVAIMIGFLLLL